MKVAKFLFASRVFLKRVNTFIRYRGCNRKQSTAFFQGNVPSEARIWSKGCTPPFIVSEMDRMAMKGICRAEAILAIQ